MNYEFGIMNYGWRIFYKILDAFCWTLLYGSYGGHAYQNDGGNNVFVFSGFLPEFIRLMAGKNDK